MLHFVFKASQNFVSSVAFWLAQYSITKNGKYTLCNLYTITDTFVLENEQFNTVNPHLGIPRVYRNDDTAQEEHQNATLALKQVP